MKSLHLYLFTAALLFAVQGKADTFNVATPGTLETIVNNADNDSITELTVKGTINWKDLKFIRSQSGRVKALQVIDLTDVQIEESEDSCYAKITENLYIGYFYYSNTPRTEERKSMSLVGTWTIVKSGVMDISCAIFEWFVRIGHFVCWSRRCVLQGVQKGIHDLLPVGFVHSVMRSQNFLQPRVQALNLVRRVRYPKSGIILIGEQPSQM